MADFISIRSDAATKQKLREAMVRAECTSLTEVIQRALAPLTTGTVASRTKAARDLRDNDDNQRG